MHPSSADVEAHLRKVTEQSDSLAHLRTAGSSSQGRPIFAMTITDNQVADDDKQHVMVIAGQHGNEESARLVALALIDWLVSDEAAEVRRRQNIIIMPNVNPDGAEADTYKTAQDVQLNAEHGPAGATSPEGLAIQQIAFEHQPEAFVDFHSRGFAGYGFDMVLYPWTRCYTEDQMIIQAIASDMAAAGESAGIPHLVHSLTWPGWEGTIRGLDNPKAVTFAYRHFKAISILTETAESNEISAPAERRARAGVARMRALLEWGHRRHPFMYYPGYPVSLAVNMSSTGVTAVGRTAADRRRSRVDLWNHADHFRSIEIKLPEYPDRKTVTYVYDGESLSHGAGFHFRAAGHWAVKSATLNGKALSPSETDGYFTWQDVCSTYIVAAVPELTAGSYRLDVELK